MRRTLVLAGGLAAAALATTACGGSSHPAALPSTLPSTPPSGTSVPGLVPGSPASLVGLLVAVPGGDTAVQVPGASDGSLDLDGFMAYRYRSTAQSVAQSVRARLSDQGFSVAAERIWRSPSGDLGTSELIEFTGIAGAGKHNQDQDAAFANGTTFTLLGTIDGADGEAFAATATDSNGYWRTVALGRVDDVYVQVDLLSKEAAAPLAPVQALFVDQVHALEQSGGVSPTAG